MSCRDHHDLNAALGEVAPAVFRIERTPKRVPRAAQKKNASRKGLWLVAELSADVDFPQSLLLFGKGGEVHQVLDIQPGQFRSGEMRERGQIFSKQLHFPTEEIAALGPGPLPGTI